MQDLRSHFDCWKAHREIPFDHYRKRKHDNQYFDQLSARCVSKLRRPRAVKVFFDQVRPDTGISGCDSSVGYWPLLARPNPDRFVLWGRARTRGHRGFSSDKESPIVLAFLPQTEDLQRAFEGLLGY